MDGKQKVAGPREMQRGITSAEMGQIQKLLKEQRKSIIDSMKNNLPAYLNYKFSITASERQLNQIRLALIEFDQSPISESLCEATKRNPAHGFNVFYQEVNRIIGATLKLSPQF
jgi:hypothetical protein